MSRTVERPDGDQYNTKGRPSKTGGLFCEPCYVSSIPMTIYDCILHRLDEGEAQTLAQVFASVPGLAAGPYSSDVLHLLLRLDRRLRPLNGGRWTLATSPHTPEQRIVASAKAYLDSLPGDGALLDSVVTRVAGETNYALDTVRSVISRYFVNNGRVVRNQLKETLSR